MTIDAHQHFWKFDPIRNGWIDPINMSIIRRDFLPDDLSPLLISSGIDGCVAVQADQSENETFFLLSLANKYDFIQGVVGWIDLQAVDILDRLASLKVHNKLKGFRHILQGERPEFMLDSRFIHGLQAVGACGYTYDILVFPSHLKAVRTLLRHIQDQLVVIDHIAKPYISRKQIKSWAHDIKCIARHQNVYCKLSGMVTEADWDRWHESDFVPYLDTIFETFGTERLMYGSDWPVCLVAATYEKQISIIRNYVNKNAPDSLEKIFGENAINFYKL